MKMLAPPAAVIGVPKRRELWRYFRVSLLIFVSFSSLMISLSLSLLSFALPSVCFSLPAMRSSILAGSPERSSRRNSAGLPGGASYPNAAK